MAQYAIGDYRFSVEEFFPREIFDRITQIRVSKPEVIQKEIKKRVRREKLTVDGKLTILAADHPGRMVVKSGDDPTAMGDRYQLLGRILRVLTNPEFDGLMTTPDIMEEVMIVNYLHRKNGGKSFLDGKALIGCMNRGGLLGAAFELDDRFTAYTARGIKESRLDGAKLMFRLDPESADAGRTIAYNADAVNDLNKYEIPVFLEALFVLGRDQAHKALKEAEPLIKVMGVASALGSSSRNTWLKIPYCDNYEAVARATTCPVLMLGGASTGNPTDVIDEFVNGMRAGASIRGALVGRNVTFPGLDDPLAVALAVNGVVHEGYDTDAAVDRLLTERGSRMDLFTKKLG